jgi:hypothetical protein
LILAWLDVSALQRIAFALFQGHLKVYRDRQAALFKGEKEDACAGAVPLGSGDGQGYIFKTFDQRSAVAPQRSCCINVCRRIGKIIIIFMA